MFKYVIFVFSTVLLAQLSYSQWTPDPLCPYPSEVVTNFPCYGNCSVYWACFEGSKFLVECPEGQEFDVATSACASPEVAQCDPYVSTSTTTEITSSTGTTTTATESTSTTTTESTSTTTTESTSTTSSVSTTESSTTTDTSSTTEGPYPQCPPSEELIYLPYLGDCSKYWECLDGVSYLYNCPNGLWWHQEVLQCDYPGDFCDNSTTSPDTTVTLKTTTSIPTTISTTVGSTTTEGPYPQCPSSEGIIYLPYLGDCSKYWECIDGVSYLYNCSEGLWWHQEILQCDYPGDFCDNSITSPDATVTLKTTSTPTTQFSTVSPTDSTSTSDPNDTTCPNPNDAPVYFPVSGDCTRYWECFEGIKYLLDCPSGQWWHEGVEKCEEPGDYCQTEFLM